MAAICKVIAEEKVSFMAGVPTIWLMLYNYLEAGGKYDFSSLKTIVSGGSACPRFLMETLNEKYGFPIMQAYGMTETTPLALAAIPKGSMADWSKDKLYDVKSSAGILAPGLEMKIVNEKGQEVKADGKEWGELLFRGPWIAKEYYKDPERSKPVFEGGWLHTGDVGTIDEEGYVRLVDRTKDLVKSGGEWISSVDLENLIMAHPAIAEAAVIGIPHSKWVERPLGCVVVKPGCTVTEEELKVFLKDKVKAAWWIPDHFVFLDQIPKTSVGKFSKKDLREMVASGKIRSRMNEGVRTSHGSIYWKDGGGDDRMRLAINSTEKKGQQTMITLPELPYAKDALAPVISANTLEFHYGKHHRAYVDNLDKLIAGTELADADLETIIKKVAGDPAKVGDLQQRRPGLEPFLLLEMPEGRRRRRADRRRRREDQRRLGKLRKICGRAEERRRDPVRQRLGMAGPRRRSVEDHEDRQRRHAHRPRP